MKLLYLVRDPFPTFRPDLVDLFGAMLPLRGVGCTLVAPPAQGAGPDAGWGGGPVLLDRPRASRLGRMLGGFLHDLACLVRHSRGHDAIQVRNKPVAALAALAVARWRGVPCFYWMSFLYPEDDLARADQPGMALLRAAFLRLRGRITGWLLYRVVLRRCDHAFVQSPRMRDDMAARGIPRERMTPVPMGVNLDRIDQALAGSPVAPAQEPTLVYLGSLDRSRQLDLLLDALARVRAAGVPARLLLVGDAPDPGERERFLALARDRGLDQAVEITGWLPQAEAWRRAARCQVGVSSLPLGPITAPASLTKAVELMALGLPMVVSEHPDQGELVTASGAGRSAPFSPEAFAAAILDILADPAAAREMGRRGREAVQAERSYAAIADRVAEAYRRLLTPTENRA